MGSTKRVKIGHGDIDDLLAAAQKAGWRVEMTKNAHIVLFPPDHNKQPIFTSSSPSDWRTMKNLRSRLRRAGLEV